MLHPFTYKLTLYWSLFVSEATCCICECAHASYFCAFIWVCRCWCVFCSVQLRLCGVAKWTSVNKLCADYLFNPYAGELYSCVLLLVCLEGKKSLCSCSFVWGTEIIARSAQMWLLLLRKCCTVYFFFFFPFLLCWYSTFLLLYVFIIRVTCL